MAGDLSTPAPPPGSLASSAGERARRRGLRRAKAYATALLVLATGLLVVARVAQSHGAGGWAGYLRAGAEAGIVGGLADWFAVTALFRRPLGLPIPHTAIVPTRKDALGQSLADFVGMNFLSEPVVRDRIGRAHVARRLGGWLSRPDTAERVTAEAATGVRAVVSVLRDEDVQAVLESALRQRLARVEAAPALGRLLGRIVEDGAHHGLVDLLLSYGHAWVRDHQAVVTAAVLRQAPDWTPRFLDERVAARVYADLLRALADIAADPQHPARLALDGALGSLATSLREDPATAARVDAARDRLLDHPDVRAVLGDLLSSGRRLLLELVEDPSSDLRLRVTEAVRELGERLSAEPALQSKVDGWLADAAAYVVGGYRDEIAATISETVARWDAADTARKVELQVGRDLQFIRINGTVVGALAGLVLHAVTTSLS